MSDLKKVVLCSEKLKSKNLGQNPDNLKHFLMKDFNFDCAKASKLIDEAIIANITKSVIFSGKVAFRIIRANSNAETQESNSYLVQNDIIEDRNCCRETGVIEDSQNPPDDQQISNTIIENFRSMVEAAEKRFMKIEDHM